MDIIDTYLEDMETTVRTLSRSDIRGVVDILEAVWRARGSIYLIGNGGSASTASHMMNDLCKCTRVEGALPVRAIALTDNVPLMTAYANDVDFDQIFVAALQSLMRPGDVVIALSGSGNSPNILRACEYALLGGATVVGLCGSPGGELATIASERVIVPAKLIAQQEDGHLMIGHILALALRDRIRAAYQDMTHAVASAATSTVFSA